MGAPAKVKRNGRLTKAAFDERPGERNLGNRLPTGRPRGTGRAGMGVGPAHSTEETGNDRGGKGPELKGQRRKQRGNEGE